MKLSYFPIFLIYISTFTVVSAQRKENDSLNITIEQNAVDKIWDAASHNVLTMFIESNTQIY